MIIDTRDKEVLNMQFTLIPILAKAWNKSYSELSAYGDFQRPLLRSKTAAMRS